MLELSERNVTVKFQLDFPSADALQIGIAAEFHGPGGRF